jgi:CHAT domain-containing protein
MWPVSDAAAAIWVPAFYSALTADPQHDAAEALRIAQLKLRDSRAFRHPFYWAGLQAFARVALDDQALRQQSVGAALAHD